MPRALRPDMIILFTVMVLVCAGLSMVLSASAIVSLQQHNNPYYFFWKHFIWALVGFAGLYFAYRVDYEFYRKWAIPAFLLSGILLILVLVPGIGREIAGVKRWFKLGPVSFQPSELTKLTAIAFLAVSLSASGQKLRDFTSGLLPNLVMIGFVCGLILLEPDLGSAMTLGLVSVIFLFIGGARLRHLLGVAGCIVPVFILSVLHKPYQWRRLKAFIDPWKDPGDSGFQIIQSMVALGHGGVKGMGLGDGWQKLFFLPAAHTDFVLAVIGEELGMLGVLAVVALFAIFWWRGVRTALRAPDDFGRYLALGITLSITFQAILNAGVVTGLLPTKGMTMPFLSYGGSSLAMNLVAVGILLNISQHCEMEDER